MDRDNWEFHEEIAIWEHEMGELTDRIIDVIARKITEGVEMARRAPDFETQNRMHMAMNSYLHKKRMPIEWSRKTEERVRLPKKAKLERLEVVRSDRGSQE